jgi:hypothetical protein
MPGADELFGTTAGAGAMSGPGLAAVGSTVLAARPGSDRLRAVPDPVEDEDCGEPGAARGHGAARPARVREAALPARGAGARGATGRERHDEKITVYVSPTELLGLERARIALRAEHGLALDRGRIVREAVDLVLADFEANGDASLLVRSLRGD